VATWTGELAARPVLAGEITRFGGPLVAHRWLGPLPGGAFARALTCWLAGQAAAGALGARLARRVAGRLPAAAAGVAR
jgi:hypothetical protein